MKYGLILGIILIFSFTGSCVGQSVVGNKKKGTGNIIIDPVGMLPFNIYRQNMFVTLPDSLGGKEAKGLVVLYLYINRKAMVDSLKS